MDVEAVKGEVLRVSNRSCESVVLVGNTLECTVPSELQSTSRELEVEVRDTRRSHSSLYCCSFRSSLSDDSRLAPSGILDIIFFLHGCLVVVL